MTDKCPNCAGQISVKAIMCPYCGAVLTETQGPAAAAEGLYSRPVRPTKWEPRPILDDNAQPVVAPKLPPITSEDCTAAGVVLPVVSFPAVLALLNRSLRRHVDSRLAAGPMMGEQFALGRGQRLKHTFARCGGRSRHPGWATLVALYGIILLAAAFVYTASARAPEGFGRWHVLRKVVAGEPARAVFDDPSVSEYARLTAGRVEVEAVVYKVIRPLNSRAEAAHLPEIRSSHETYCMSDRFQPLHGVWRKGLDGAWYEVRVLSAVGIWPEAATIGLILYAVFVPLFLLVAAAMSLGFWLRFARHRAVEVRLAAQVAGEADIETQLLPEITRANRKLMLVMTVLVVTQLHLLVLPFVAPRLLRRHFIRESQTRVGELLGSVEVPLV